MTMVETCNERLINLPDEIWYNLPDEIWYDIFSKLPIQALYQCMFVSKQWNDYLKSLVTDPCFAKLHHSQINQDNSNFFSLCCNSKYNSDDNYSKLYLIDHENFSTTSLNALDTYYHLPSTNFKVIGSCNGLLCICSFGRYKAYYVCNSVTREIIQLPTTSDEPDLGFIPGCFFFDKISNTYNLVRRRDFLYKNKFTTVVEIYTLGSGRWRRLPDLTNYYFYRHATTQLFLNGAVHWVVFHKESDIYPYQYDIYIGVVDIRAEKFTTFQGPPLGVNHDGRIMTYTLRLLGESLCVIDDKSDGYIVLWIMKNYGIEDSWTKEYIIRKETLGLKETVYHYEILTIHKCILVLFDGCKGYYDLEKEEFKPIQIHGILSSSQAMSAVFHIGSLISPKLIDAGTSAQVESKTWQSNECSFPHWDLAAFFLRN